MRRHFRIGILSFLLLVFICGCKKDIQKEGVYEISTQEEFEELSNIVFEPGDEIRLERGKTFKGGITLKGSGTVESPVRVTAFGAGDKPVINGEGSKAVIYIKNEQHWSISDLTITNSTGENDYANKDYNGIYIISDENSVFDGFTIADVDFHNVDGDYSCSPWTASVHFAVEGDYESTKFSNILIDSCTFQNQWSFGVLVQSMHHKNVNHSKNVIIRNCMFSDLGGMAWLYYGVDDGVVEDSAWYDIGRGDRAFYSVIIAGFPRDCNNITVQRCESARIVESGDSHAWDIDINMGGTCIWQYNYSHDNPGGFFLSLGDNEEDLVQIIRYNISQNDGNAKFDLRRDAKTLVYNNTVYTDYSILVASSCEKHEYYNNVFYCMSGKLISFPIATKFDSNCYYGFTPLVEDEHAVLSDPMLSDPGTGGDGRNTTQGYKLLENSPCIDAGKKIDNSGNTDYFGYQLQDEITDIGAAEYQK